MAYTRNNFSSLEHPQGFGGFFSKIFEKTGAQVSRTGGQVAKVEDRFTAVGKALRGKSAHAPAPMGPTPEQLAAQAEKEAALEQERQAALEEQRRLEAQLAAEREQAAAERAALQQQMEQQAAEQQQFQQQMMLQLQESQKGFFTRLIESIFGRKQQVSFGNYPRQRRAQRTRKNPNPYFQGWHYF